jgi:hypothetical protein
VVVNKKYREELVLPEIVHQYTEKHYRLSDLSIMWSLSRETVRKLVKDDPGVIKVRLGRKRSHTTWIIPASAARRIYNKLMTGM